MYVNSEVGEESPGGYGREMVVGVGKGVKGRDRVQAVVVGTADRWGQKRIRGACCVNLGAGILAGAMPAPVGGWLPAKIKDARECFDFAAFDIAE